MIVEMKRASRDFFFDFKQFITEIRYKGPYGKREATLNGYIEFSCPDVRDATLKALGKDASITFKGSKVNVKPAKTRIDSHRDAILNIAATRVRARCRTRKKPLRL